MDGSTERDGRIQDAVDALLKFCSNISTQKPKTVLIAFAAIAIFAGVGANRVEIETIFSKRLSSDNPARVAEEFLREHFVNSTQFEIYIDSGSQDGILKADFFNRFATLESEIESLPSVAKVLSLVDLMSATHAAIVGRPGELVPATDESLAQLMVMLEQEGPSANESLVDFQRRTTRLSVFTQNPGIVGAHGVRLRVVEMAKDAFGDDVTVEALGIAPMMGAWVGSIIDGQKRGLLFSLTLIGIILVIAFRSVRVGLFSMIPNMLPLLGILGYVGWAWDKTDSDLLIVMMIAIGIGVDDTIHFLSRLQLESRRTDDLTEAIDRTFRFSGRGILITTFVFVVGFLPMLLADYFTISIMGSMLPYCFFIAVLADLILLPAMARVGLIRF